MKALGRTFFFVAIIAMWIGFLWFIFTDPMGIHHKPATAAPEETRFDIKYIPGPNGSFALVTDEATGAQYLSTYQGCIIKLEV